MKFLEFTTEQNMGFFCLINTVMYIIITAVSMHCSQVLGKAYCKVFLKCIKLQKLYIFVVISTIKLLSTTILNDYLILRGL